MPLLRAVKEVLPPELELRATRQPLLWAALAYGAGIGANTYVLRAASLRVAGGLAFLFLVASLACLRSRITFAAAMLTLGALFFAGAMNMYFRGMTGVVDTTFLPFDGQSVELVGHVAHQGSWRDAGPGEMRETVDVASEEIIG